MSKWIIIVILFIVLFCTYLYPSLAKKYSYLLILNNRNQYELPKNFHITPFHTSGSGQFSKKGLEKVIAQIPSENIIIVDLRQEPHGFLNGNAITWYRDHNWGDLEKNSQQAQQHEQNFINDLENRYLNFLFYDRLYPVPFLVKTVNTEEEIVTSLGMRYKRFAITDHRRPKDQDIDDFIEWYLQLPGHFWLHFHCSAGRGRTTTFLAMHDIMKNGATDSLEIIVKRQHKLGGSNLLRVSEADEDNWKKKHIGTRTRFIRSFYEYCKEVPDLSIRWSEWIEQKGITPYN